MKLPFLASLSRFIWYITAGEQPDRGIAGRNSSRTMSRAGSSSRRVL